MKKNIFILILVLALAGVAATLLPGLLAGEGMVMIVTTPGDAQLFINGERKGNSPAELWQSYAIQLMEGSYKIEAILPSDGPEENYGVKDDVFVAKDSMQTVSLELKKRPSAAFREKLKAKYPGGPPEPKMVAIPGGSFMMGSNEGSDEKPVHQVTLAPFSLSATEITFEQYDACVDFGGCDHLPDDEGWGRGNRPVINVSWKDAKQYIQWLNQETGKNYQLPTEAQWEYAARAGSTTNYCWGNEVGRNNANCDGCGSPWDGKQTAPVGSFAANAFGLYDMHGNVWEWCQDWYDSKYYQSSPAADPQGPTSGGGRVLRGSSWNSYPSNLRSASRINFSPGDRYNILGFRLSLPRQ